jgi:hypothetical protein
MAAVQPWLLECLPQLPQAMNAVGPHAHTQAAPARIISVRGGLPCILFSTAALHTGCTKNLVHCAGDQRSALPENNTVAGSSGPAVRCYAVSQAGSQAMPTYCLPVLRQ